MRRAMELVPVLLYFCLGIVLLAINANSETEKSVANKCYIARTCIHNGIEKCGINTNGELRRFFDTCDMLEYNCLYDTEYTKSSKSRCKKLPPIPAEVKKQRNETETEMERKGKHSH